MRLMVRAVVLLMSLLAGSTPALAEEGDKPKFVAVSHERPSVNRLIVKLRPAKSEQVRDMAQFRRDMSRPYSQAILQRLQTAAGHKLGDLRPTVNGAHLMNVSGDTGTLKQAIAALSKLPEVEYVEEDRIERIRALPNDTRYAELWNLHPVIPGVSHVYRTDGNYGADFETAWSTSTGAGVVVAVIDTGITPHSDLVGAGGSVSPATGNLVSPGYDFITDCRLRGSCAASTSELDSYIDPSPNATDTGDWVDATDTAANSLLFPVDLQADSSWHGTHVSGTIAALGNNAQGIIGGAYNAKILPVRALGKGGGYMSDISEAIMWSAGVHPTIANPNPAKVINMSLGSTDSCQQSRQDAINAVVAAGVVVVVAAGNEASDVAYASSANCQNVISVAAVARDGSRATYSNYSSPTSSSNRVNVTLAAQGGEGIASTFDPGILSTVNFGLTTIGAEGYDKWHGTSMATPHVSATVALMLAHNPTLTPAGVKMILSSPVALTPFPSFNVWSAWDCTDMMNCGAGILNAKLAVKYSTILFALTAGDLNFATVAVGASASRTITLTNITNVVVTADTPVFTGLGAALYNVTANTCNVAVSPAQTCQITVDFNPNSASASTAASLVLTSNEGIFQLDTSGQMVQALDSVDTFVNAPAVQLGNATFVTLSFYNPNSISVQTSVIQLSDPTIMFIGGDTCSKVTLPAHATCSVTIYISPLVTGNYFESITLGIPAYAVADASTSILGAAIPSSSGSSSTTSGGGGCSIMPPGATPDASLLLALLSLLLYRLSRRNETTRRDE